MSSKVEAATIGGAVLLSSGRRGWDPGALLFPAPLMTVRFSRGMTRVTARGAAQPWLECERDPLAVLEEVFVGLKSHLPAAGPKAPSPAFPMAIVAAAFEFGRWFSPHEHAFPHADTLADDEFFAAVYIDAYRPDLYGGTERIGYAGSIPVGWMEGAPELETAPYGHEAPPIIAHPVSPGVTPQRLEPVMSREEYRSRVDRIREYLAAGDIYQANLTIPLRGKTTAAPEAILDAAHRRGGASFAMMMVVPGGTILSLSPELYLRRRGDDIQTRPIKGTRRIPLHMGGIQQATEDLKTSEKDRAEHVMIVDLERNDLGRVCLPGTVKAKPLMKAVEHGPLLHLESKVFGELRSGVRITDLFSATFPGGSVTGAPKKRALEILGELEIAPRGYYCGALGWIDCKGDCDLNLPIRTAMIRPDGTVEFHSGGGIVADSDADREWEEMLLKTEAFCEALREAESPAPR